MTTLWAAPASGSSATPLVFTVKVLRYNSSGTLLSTLDTETVGSGAWNCVGFKKFGSTIAFGSGNGTSLSANDYIGVQVTVTGGDAVLVTRVACHPEHEVIAAGFADGLVLLTEIASRKVLPVAAPGNGPVSALAWSSDGRWLAFGTETGFAAIIDFAPR